jgi:hypothetical protein
MTVTVSAPATEATGQAGLTDLDAIISAGEREPDQYACDLPLHVGVSVHLRAETPVQVRLWPDQNRAVVSIGMHRAGVDLFVDADQIDRLITLLTATRQRLA